MRSSPTSLLLLLPLAACAPAVPSSGTAAPRPLPDIALEQCGPASNSGTVYLEGQVATRPNLKKAGRIRYPAALRAADIRGEVRLAFVIDTAGKPVEGSVRTLEASDPGFVESARGLVLTSKFTPALFEGHAVAVCTAQTIHYTP